MNEAIEQEKKKKNNTRIRYQHFIPLKRKRGDCKRDYKG